MDAPSGNSPRLKIPYVLTPTHPVRAHPAREGQEGPRAGLPEINY